MIKTFDETTLDSSGTDEPLEAVLYRVWPLQLKNKTKQKKISFVNLVAIEKSTVAQILK